ncbi:MAG TPA: phosphatidate cytidylyltransferase [Gemmatimonadaceae bacterium]|nr:phosphatidate cytidylyltransferase [Gemmatimonadaceae bacterium]
MSELAKRVIVALIIAPIAVIAAWFGDAALASLLGIVAGVAAWELCRMARGNSVEPLEWLTIGLAALVPLFAHGSRLGVLRPSGAAFAVALLVVMTITIFRRPIDRRPLAVAAISMFIVMYTGGMLSFAYDLRYHNYAIGRTAQCLVLLLPVLLTWASDVGAYFVGRLFGRTKLMPSVSPAKTVEGSVGGIVLSVAICWVYVRQLLVPHGQLGLAPLAIVFFGTAIAVAAQVGDLFESMLKREAKMKDSSSLLPGHGGFLDRVDSLLFVLPVATLLLNVLLIPAPQS